MTEQGSPTTPASFKGVLKGKKGLILGVANNRSIAWGIAKAASGAGAELALTYQGEALEKRVRPLAAELGATVVGRCDVTETATIDAVFAEVEKLWGKLDFVVHASPSPTRINSTADMSIRLRRISTSRWRSHASRSPPSRSAPKN